MNRSEEIQPQWVLYKEQLYRVFEFAHLPPKERPKAVCPLCRQPVVLKLGSLRVHHYAHQHDRAASLCATTHPETALHLNLKFHLQDQLSHADRLTVEQPCSRCATKRLVVWLENWDDVRTEFAFGQFRLDLAFLRAGRVIGALEIFVTHAVDARKREFLDSRHIPWLEIDAAPALYEGDSAWKPQVPLPVSPTQLPRRWAPWTCPSCLALPVPKPDPLPEISLPQPISSPVPSLQTSAPSGPKVAPKISAPALIAVQTVTYASKEIELLFRSGKVRREIVYIVEEFQNGDFRASSLRTYDRERIASLPNRLNSQSLHHLEERLAHWCDAHRVRGTQVDDSMPWLYGQSR